jgi:single-strand DNA-binding protein
MSVNKVILVGNVGRDPETRHLDKGVSVSRFSLATTENYTSKTGEKVSNTEWHNIVAWRGLAEVVEKYVKKAVSFTSKDV